MTSKRPKRSTRKSASAAPRKFAPPPPQGGARLPLGAHAGNTGGKPVGSGRPPDELKDWMIALLDGRGREVLEQILNCRVTHTVVGICPKCGEQCTEEKTLGVDITQARDLMRAVELTLRYSRPIHVETEPTLEEILEEI